VLVLEGWNEFFVAAAGASAALAGLIIVAMSVNIDVLIRFPGLTSRAATAIALLVLVTMASLAGLIPDQDAAIYAIEVLVLAAIGLGFAVQSLWVLAVASDGGRQLLAAVSKGGLAIVPFAAFLIGAGLLISGAPQGMFWIAMGSLGAVLVAVIAAWVMLVEIRR
jgi:hypothetical protein